MTQTIFQKRALKIEQNEIRRMARRGHLETQIYARESSSKRMRQVLSLIEENYCNETDSFVTFCYNCFSVERALSPDKSVVFTTNTCKKCTFFAQSMLLTDSARADISKKLEDTREWLYGGSAHKDSFLEHYIKVPEELRQHIKLLEDVGLLAHQFFRSTCLFDRYLAIVNFCKLRGARIGFASTLMYVASDIFGSHVMSKKEVDKVYSNLEEHVRSEVANDFKAEAFESKEDNIFAEARKYLNCYEKLKETTLYKKLYKFLLYILAAGLLDKTKITFESLNFSSFEKAAIQRTHKPGIDMFHCILDTICFVCDRGMQYFHTGNPEVIFHSGNAYDKWVKDVDILIRNSRLLGDAQAHGINKFAFLGEVKVAIEKGEAIVKFTAGLDKFEKMYVQKKLYELKMVESEQLTKKAAQQPRKEPFAVLLHGSPCICKSQLKQILFYHYGKVFGHPTEAQYMYTRCPTDEFWSGFDSSMWCVCQDDIAFLKPDGEVDPTLKEMLQIKNSVPYSPPQAALEDKGRTPLRAELVIGTTNTKHLNLQAYFSCPYAIARRMSYIVTAHIKPEFAKNSFMADSTKIPITDDGEYMNIWNFDVSVPVPLSDIEVDCQGTKYKLICQFDDINDMLSWFIDTAREHNVSQAKALAADTTMSSIELCKKCDRTVKRCVCVAFEAQAEQENGMDPIEEFISSQHWMYQLQAWFAVQIISGQPSELTDYWQYFAMQETLLKGIICALWFLVCLNPCVLYIQIFLISCRYVYKYFFCVLHWWAQRYFGLAWKFQLLMYVCSDKDVSLRLIMYIAGQRAKRLLSHPTLTLLACWLGTALVVYQLQSVFCGFMGFSCGDTNKELKKKMGKKDKTFYDAPHLKGASLETKVWAHGYNSGASYSTCEEVGDEFTPQVSVGVTPIPLVAEKPTFYYHDAYANTGVEISSASQCSQGDVIENVLRGATAKFTIQGLGEKTKMRTVALNIRGTLWLLNKHSMKFDAGTIEIVLDPVEQNVSRNVELVHYTAHDVRRSPFSDWVVIDIRALPPGKDLVKYFPLDGIIKGCYKGKYYTISHTGERSEMVLSCIRSGMCPVFKVPAYLAASDKFTVSGDCGTPCLAEVGSSKVILGIHITGNGMGAVYVLHISQKELNEVLSEFVPQVSCGEIPISAPGYERTVVDVHPKSAFRFIEHGTAHVVGSFAGYRPRHKSRVKKSLLCDYMVAKGYQDKYGSPDMSWKPWHLALKDMTTSTHVHQNEKIDECVSGFVADVLKGLGSKIKQIQTYNLETAVNGADGVAFVDRMNISTSAGNPFKKSKKNFVRYEINEKGCDRVVLDDVILDRIKTIEDCYSKGVRFHPQFCCHLKDEPTPQKKIDAGKTRVFMGGEFAWSVVVRRYFLSHIRMIQNNPFLFESMPGITCQSRQWDRLYKEMVKFGPHKIIAGDYGKFDKKMRAAFILGAFEILIQMSIAAETSIEEITAMRCIAYDTAWASLDFNGDLVEIPGNPSGNPLTVIINCLVNCLYMRYAFTIVTKKPVTDFKKFVSLATYGDDNIMGVSDECPEFTHTRISIAMKCIGVEYTMADKEAESVPYIHIDDASFLKRKFVWDENLQSMSAPLEHDSICKMLTNMVDTGTLAPEAHALCVIETALREYFFFGKERFNERREFFQQAIVDNKLEAWVRDSTFPLYEELIADYNDRSAAIEAAERGVNLLNHQRSTGQQIQEKTCFKPECWVDSPSFV
jgi:hypothetical protein